MSRTLPATALLVATVIAAVSGPTVAAAVAVASTPPTAVDGVAAHQVGVGGWTVSTTSDELAVSGRSNRAAGTTVVVELIHSNGTTVRMATTSVSHGTWNTTLDVTDLARGTYQLRVTDGVVAASTSVALVSTTPSETPFEPTTHSPSYRRTPTATVTPVPTPAPLPSPVPTLAQSPGFDVVAALVALFVSVGTLVWRRRRRR